MPKQSITERSEIEAILNEGIVGSLATVNEDGSPYVVTVNYVFYNGKIYFHCALKGKKLDNITHDPRICFEIHIIDKLVITSKADSVSVRYRSAIIFGHARLINDPQIKKEALIALTDKYTKGHSVEPPSDNCIANTGVVEIDIDNITGKKNIE